eukprot:Gb_32743 [translate_table: standard]
MVLVYYCHNFTIIHCAAYAVIQSKIGTLLLSRSGFPNCADHTEIARGRQGNSGKVITVILECGEKNTLKEGKMLEDAPVQNVLDLMKDPASSHLMEFITTLRTNSHSYCPVSTLIVTSSLDLLKGFAFICK